MIQLSTLFTGRIFRWAITITWTIFLSILLLQPENQPIIPTGVQPAPPSLSREILFSSVHIIAMSLTALLWCFAFNIRDSTFGVVSLIIVLVSYGLVVEYLQGSVPGRTAQWWDMLANSMGIGLGFWLWYRLKKSSMADTSTITI